MGGDVIMQAAHMDMGPALNYIRIPCSCMTLQALVLTAAKAEARPCSRNMQPMLALRLGSLCLLLLIIS